METTTLLFLALVGLGAFVQTITGFAMGLIIIAGVTALGIAEVSFSAAVISLISLVNTLVALRQSRKHIAVKYLKWISIGLIPSMLLGIWLLAFLSEGYYYILRNLLGLVIIAAGIMLMVTPRPYEKLSDDRSVVACGALGGVIAGLYSAGGAPLAYFMYRQPLELNVIRATLLSVFAVSTFVRAIMVGVAGHIDLQVLTVALFSVPIVVVTTVITGKFTHLFPDKLVRRMVFFLLISVGAFLLAT